MGEQYTLVVEESETLSGSGVLMTRPPVAVCARFAFGSDAAAVLTAVAAEAVVSLSGFLVASAVASAEVFAAVSVVSVVLESA